jgi:hypothetical protein
LFQCVTQETNNHVEIEESQPINVETVPVEDLIESNPSVTVENNPIPNESTTIPTTKSWWSSLARLFHFGQNSTETKVPLDTPTDKTEDYLNGSYLGAVKSRRSLHGDALVG